MSIQSNQISMKILKNRDGKFLWIGKSIEILEKITEFKAKLLNFVWI